MRLNQGIAMLCGAMLFATPALFGASKECAQLAPTARSYTWDFSSEANEIFGRLHDQAEMIRQESIGLARQARYDSGISWLGHSTRMAEVKKEVNSMGDELCRLQTIRRELEPWQKNAVDRIAPEVVSIALDAEAAIDALSDNPHRLFATGYADRVQQISKVAEQVSDTTDNLVEYAKHRKQIQNLEKSLELSDS